MAARQQPKGTGLGIQYEDLVPKSEWKDQPEATLLTIDLPGFAKEQIKVTYVHTSKMIRVTGERPLADRRWSRFNEVFNVPQNSLVDKIHGSFKNNVLTITIPKEKVTKVVNVPEYSKTLAEEVEKMEKLEEKRLLEDSRKKEEAGKKKRKELLEEKEGLIRKLQEEAKAKEKAEAARKLEEEVKAKEKADKVRKLEEEAKAKKKLEDEKKLVEEATLEKKSVDESRGKEKILKPEERKLPEVVYTKPKTGTGSGSKFGSEGVGEVVKSAEEKLGYLVEKEKKMGKGIMEKMRRKEITSEEKKLMVNVGVAALVIFALGAYVSYTFCASSSSSSSSSSPPSSSSSTKPE